MSGIAGRRLAWASLGLLLTTLFVSPIARAGGAELPSAPQPPAPERPADEPPGQADFDRVCKACHGERARGDAGPRLVPFSRQYEEVLAIVREGLGQMPPISVRELSDEGVAGIVAYLKSLSE